MTSATLATIMPKIDTASANIGLEVQALATPLHRVVAKESTLSAMQSQMNKEHEMILDIRRNLLGQNLLTSELDLKSAEHRLVTALGEIGAERDLLRSTLNSFDRRWEVETNEIKANIESLVCRP